MNSSNSTRQAQTSQDQQFLAKTDTNAAPVWVKPQMTQTPLREALSGGNNTIDGLSTGGSPIGFS